jgi:hypothetical protein
MFASLGVRAVLTGPQARYKQNRPSQDIGGHDRTMEEISEFVLTSVLTLPFLKP